MTRTLEELERHAYITGDTVTADLLGQVIDLTDSVEVLDDRVNHLEDLLYERTH